MKLVVVGYGFVGRAVYDVLKDKHTMGVIDPEFVAPTQDPIFRNRVGRTVEDIQNIEPVDGFVICVPTPEADNGRCDDSLVSDYVYEIIKHQPHAHILIKSTTSVETLSDFQQFHRVTFSPEFLRGSISTDPTKEFRECDFAIFGGNDGRWWYEVFRELLDIKEVRFLDICSAGFLKYAENSFLATKVTFFNELYSLYRSAIGGNYDAMIEALALDERIGLSHTQVPGPDGEFGWGGHCLPKDTSEFVKYAEDQEHPLQLLEMVRKLNKLHRD